MKRLFLLMEEDPELKKRFAKLKTILGNFDGVR
jgi:hypothetical protein